MAVWLKTQGLCNLLQLASNILVASARGQTETRASYRYQQLSVAATEKLRVRALSYKAVFSIRATKYLSNKSCQCAPSLIVCVASNTFAASLAHPATDSPVSVPRHLEGD
jgi:hypothetical protein